MLKEMASLKIPKLLIPYLIFITLIFIECSYQVAKVIEVYFKFPTKVDVSFDWESQIVVPLITFCRARSYLHKSLSISFVNRFSPSLLYNTTFNTTFNTAEVFRLCSLGNDDDDQFEQLKCDQLKNRGFQITKTVNFYKICYNFNHPQFSCYKPRKQGVTIKF